MEEKLAKQIRQLIEADENDAVEIAIGTFVRIWGKDVMDKLLKFTRKNGFGYISILQPGGRIVSVRFWKIKGKHLLEEGEHAENTD